MTRSLLAAGVVVALAGCAHGQSATPVPDPETTTAAMCPLVPFTTVESRDITNGVAFVFVTNGSTEQLRNRLANWASYEEQIAATASGGASTASYSEGGEARASASAGQEQQAACPAGFFGVPVRAQVIDIRGGSQLNVEPLDPGQLATLRQNAQQVLKTMQGGDCPNPSGP